MSGPGIHPYHQQWSQPPPAMPSLIPPFSNAGEILGSLSTVEIRTIFITGLPGDVKERELYNLLRWLPGFETSQINFKGDLPMGFALFSTNQHAVAAKNALENLVYDAESQSTLHTEMAKKNLFVKRGVGVDFSSFDQSKRLRTDGDYAQLGYQSLSPFHPQQVPVWATSGYIAPPAPFVGMYPVPQVAVPRPTTAPALNGHAPVPVNAKDNPPCNTLFVGNLGESVVEEELRGLFSIQHGYKQMKILHQERNTVCFIEFDDVGSAISVHANLQGVVFPSSGRGGIRIHFRKILLGIEKNPLAVPLPKPMELQFHNLRVTLKIRTFLISVLF